MKKLFSFMAFCAGLMGDSYASKEPSVSKDAQAALWKALEPSVLDRLACAAARLKLGPQQIFGLSDVDMRKQYASSRQAPLVDEVIFLRQTPEAQDLFIHMVGDSAQSKASTFKPFVDKKASDKELLLMKVRSAREAAQKRGQGRR